MPRKLQFSQLRKLLDLDLDLRLGWGHTMVGWRSTHTHQIRSKSERLCGRTDVRTYERTDGQMDGRTDGRTDTPEFQSFRSSLGDDLKIERFSPQVAKKYTWIIMERESRQRLSTHAGEQDKWGWKELQIKSNLFANTKYERKNRQKTEVKQNVKNNDKLEC